MKKGEGDRCKGSKGKYGWGKIYKKGMVGLFRCSYGLAIFVHFCLNNNVASLNENKVADFVVFLQ